MTIKVAIAGIAGRMGRTLAEMVHGADDLELVGGLERAGSPWLGQSIDAVLGLPAAKGDVLGDIAALPAFDVLLDFTTTQSTLAHLTACLTRGAAMVIGTTGFTVDEATKIEQASNQITIVHAQNYSIGLTLLLDLVQQTSSKVGSEADVEILEWHHNQKSRCAVRHGLRAVRGGQGGQATCDCSERSRPSRGSLVRDQQVRSGCTPFAVETLSASIRFCLR